MTTIEERREIAAKLRKIDTSDDPLNSAILLMEIEKAIGTWRTSDDWPTPEWLTGRNRDTAERLADLIEPSCDRDTPQKVAEEMFGKMRHSTKEEADAYGAMLRSKSVEIHPVDRDALLALADEMEANACSEHHDRWVKTIREAVGA